MKGTYFFKDISKSRMIEEALQHTNYIANIGSISDPRRKVYVPFLYSREKRRWKGNRLKTQLSSPGRAETKAP